MTSLEPPPSRMQLRAGQVHSLQLAAGTAIHVRAGSLLLREAPLWLGETVHTLQRRLHAGDSHVVVTGGWLQLQADDGPVTLGRAPTAPAPRPATPSWILRLWSLLRPGAAQRA